MLNPEGEVGPFYVLGEYVRSDLTDGQAGVPIVSDYQFIDVSTCEPLVGVWADVWNANSTGVYGGKSSVLPQKKRLDDPQVGSTRLTGHSMASHACRHPVLHERQP